MVEPDAERRFVVVKISDVELLNCLPLMVESMIIHKLRSCGVPVIGTLLYGGIYHGCLMQYRDPGDGFVTFVWSDRVPARFA